MPPILVLALVLVLAGPAAAQQFEPSQFAAGRWYKGNTHTHTTHSDGDTPPDSVALWYRGRGYNFLVLSDHNVFTDPKTLAALETEAFILIPGEELTSRFEGKPVHVNGLSIPHVLTPASASTLLQTIQGNIDAVRRVQGVPHVNHPNYEWAIDAKTLARLRNDKLVEIYNGHPFTNNTGAADAPGMEAVWDYLLSGGKRIYGIAVDDAHHFKQWGAEFANPGKGWIAIKALALDPRELMAALEAGAFYASTGVVLEDVVVTSSTLEVRIRQDRSFRYTTEFITNRGRVVSRVSGTVARFRLQPGSASSYVRARITDSGGKVAWVQPVFVRAQRR